MKQRLLLLLAAITLAAADIPAAPAASRLEADAVKAEQANNIERARTLYAQAAEQRMKDAEAIYLGKAKKSLDDLLDEALLDPGMEDGLESASSLSPAESQRAADAKAGILVTAANDYEKADKPASADKAFALALEVPKISDSARIDILHAISDVKLGRYDCAAAAANADKALALSKGNGELAGKRAESYRRLATARLEDGDVDGAVEARFAWAAEAVAAKQPLEPLRDFVNELLGGKHLDAALAACGRYAALATATAKDRHWACLKEAEIHRRRKDAPRALEAIDRALELRCDVTGALLAGFDIRRAIAGDDEAWKWFAAAIADVGANFSAGDMAALWSQYGYKAYLMFRPDQATRARDEIARLKKQQPSHYAGRWLHTIKAFDDFAKFPRAESEIKFPKDVTDFGVPFKAEVFAGDFGYDARDATECLQKAIDFDATTVILEASKSPWRISSVKLRSNINIVFEKGVVVLADEASQKGNAKYPMFEVKNVSNVAFIGRGDKPGDVYIGKYRDNEERRRMCHDYGGSGFAIEGAQNVVIRNVKVAECSVDGISLSSLGRLNSNIYVQDVILDGNYRQACSICNADGLYFKNVAFLNTSGGDPMCGIDLEPTYELEPNSNIYLFDCRFEGNVGGGLNFTSSSYYPVTLHAKRCDFGPHGNGAIVIFARCGVYMGANVKAPGRIIIEDSTIRGYADASPVRFSTASLFDVAFKNTQIIAEEARNPKNTALASPVLFKLDREFNLPEYTGDPSKEGDIVFENVTVKGFGKPFVRYFDTAGHYSVTKIRGEAVCDGEQIDVASFRHRGPDIGRVEIARFDAAQYLPPPETVAADAPDTAPNRFTLGWKVPWYVHTPGYVAIYGEGGTWKTRKLMKWKDIAGMKGKPVAFYVDDPEHTLRLGQGKGNEGDSFFFEVPAGGKTCTFKSFGEIELKNPKGEVAGSAAWGDGMKYFDVKPSSDAAEIWSIRIKSFANIKFFAPFSGIIAEKPEWLPRMKAVAK
ncbi:MAG: hypothetical protein ACOYD3_05930 [Kiritimatiellia bacterium]|jgi:hypothetical protein